MRTFRYNIEQVKDNTMVTLSHTNNKLQLLHPSFDRGVITIQVHEYRQ